MIGTNEKHNADRAAIVAIAVNANGTTFSIGSTIKY